MRKLPGKITSSYTYTSKANGKESHKTVAFSIKLQEDSQKHNKILFYNMPVVTNFFIIPG